MRLFGGEQQFRSMMETLKVRRGYRAIEGSVPLPRDRVRAEEDRGHETSPPVRTSYEFDDVMSKQRTSLSTAQRNKVLDGEER